MTGNIKKTVNISRYILYKKFIFSHKKSLDGVLNANFDIFDTQLDCQHLAHEIIRFSYISQEPLHSVTLQTT